MASHNKWQVRDYGGLEGLKLVAFDLDGTVWTPDMYQLWGGGAPFHHAPNGKDLLDCSGSLVRLIGISSEVLHELKNVSSLQDVKVAWVSCTDEPEWASECLSKFCTSPGSVPLNRIADSVQIYKANKQVHFMNIKKDFPDIEFAQMLFFDNESSNVRTVSKLGVRCIYCPEGITEKAWEEGLNLFRS